MDYLKAPISFKLKKTLRYLRLYGFERTMIKVQGQRHMQRKYTEMPVCVDRKNNRQRVGIIGCGNFAFSTIAYLLCGSEGMVVRGVMDIDINHAASLGSRYGAAYYTDDFDDVINDELIDLVYIASNHASHAEYAIAALNAGKSVYIEKPHVVSEDQLNRLIEAMGNSQGRVFLGFNRPHSHFGHIIRDALARESGPAMYSWFVTGHQIPLDHWYMRPEEGGRVLGNLCHWTDFILSLADDAMYPIEINPTSAGRRDCDIAVTYKFADNSIAVITFSEKGYAFEGVREKFSAHKGDCLIEMSDFQHMRIDVRDCVRKYRNFHREHGHKVSILSAYRNVKELLPYDRNAQMRYIWNTGMLFLKTKEALENDSKVVFYPQIGVADNETSPSIY